MPKGEIPYSEIERISKMIIHSGGYE